ncbi:MAG: 30S ribosomal protein S19 [Nanoarchaeota archaeon]
MARKEFCYRGKNTPELMQMSLTELSPLLGARARRKIKRGFTEAEKKILVNIKKNKKNIETHCRSMIILPTMFGHLIKVHTGKEFVPVEITEDMLGHYLGEFALTRRRVSHGSPGIGASRSSASASVK